MTINDKDNKNYDNQKQLFQNSYINNLNVHLQHYQTLDHTMTAIYVFFHILVYNEIIMSSYKTLQLLYNMSHFHYIIVTFST